MDLKKDHCRSCKIGTPDITYHSVNAIGYNSLTFKEMFEQSIGYPILEQEPQEFCNYCADKLVEWYEYKDLCVRTQETLVPIKTEPDVEQQQLVSVKEEELEDVNSCIIAENDTEALPVESVSSKNDDNPKPPCQSIDMGKYRNGSNQVTITFETYIRYYKDQQLSDSSFVGNLSMATEIPKYRFFSEMLWTNIKKYLKWEVRLDANDMPFYSPYVSPPSPKNLKNFVELFYENSSYSPNEIQPKHLEQWHGKQLTLYIYPYAKLIVTKERWIKVTKNLLKFEKAPDPEPKKQQRFQERQTSDKVPEIAKTTEVSPSTSTNDVLSLCKRTQLLRNDIRSKMKKNPFGVVSKLTQVPNQTKDQSKQPVFGERSSEHQYSSTSFSETYQQLCRLEEANTGERPSKRLKQEPTEVCDSIVELEDDDVSKVENEVE